MSTNNVDKPTLKNFCEVFHGLLMDEYARDKKKFDNDFHEDEPYTKRILRIMNTITVKGKKRYVKKGEKNGEFYTIDHTWWNDSEKEKYFNRNKFTFYNWKLLAAVEHENDKTNWTYEIEKLDSIKATLKIVIAYLPEKLREESIEKAILEEQCNCLNRLQKDEEFGVIIMNRNLAESNDPFEMKCYKFKKDGVEEVIPNK